MLCVRRFVTVFLFAYAIAAFAQEDPSQRLRDQYQGKTFLLRGFYSADHLRYDSAGVPDNPAPGDWTTDGFVRVTDLHFTNDHLIIKGQRLAAAWFAQKPLELRPAERRRLRSTKIEEVHVEIEADPGMHNPAPEQVDALLASIFLTSRDSLANLVPDYWKRCVSGGLKGTDKNCTFAPDLLTIPGVANPDSGDDSANAATEESRSPAGRSFRVGGGVSPPRVIDQRDPEFSDAARAAKFQGTVTLLVVIDKDGAPTHIAISRPLGYGLDANAVQAVQSWKFKASERDGIPVPVEIAIEVQFHLY
jgi:TonB family protein